MSRPVDVSWLVVLRIVFGAAMCISMLRFIGYGWIDDFFVNPPLHFKYWGFAWVEPLPRAGMYALFWVLAGLALSMTVGFVYRLAALLFAVGFTYLQLIDVCTYLNHYYLASLLALLLSLSPAGRAFSIDAWLARRSMSTVPAFWLYFLRFQIGVVYCFAGFAKMQIDWLAHAQPLRIWLGSLTDMPLVGALFALPGAPTAMSWAGFCFDSTVVWLLLARRTRPFAYLALLVFHIMTGLLFPIGMFPIIMSLAALVFFPPDWPRRLGAKVGRALHLGAPARTPNGWTVRCFLAVLSPGASPPPRRSKSDSEWTESRNWTESTESHGAKRSATGPHPQFWGPGPKTAHSPVANDSSSSAFQAVCCSSQTSPAAPPARVRSLLIVAAALYCGLQIALPLRFVAYGGNVLWHEQGMRFSWRVMVREKNGSLTYVVREKRTGRLRHVSPRSYLTRTQEREMATQPDLILQLAHHIRDDFERRGFGPVEIRVDAFVSLNGRKLARLIDPDVDLGSVPDGVGRATWILPDPAIAPPHTRPI